jgi:hypothetical protein
LAIRSDEATEIAAHYGIDPLGPLLLMAGAAFVACVVARPRRGLVAFGGVLASVLLVVSFWINPAMNSARSGADFMRRVEQTADPVRELGIVAAKEQYLLVAQRPIVHFGSRRWREGKQEAFDAARWLSRSPDRQPIVSGDTRDLCFTQTRQTPLGAANRTEWFLIEGAPDASCIEPGRAQAAYSYRAAGLVSPQHAD